MQAWYLLQSVDMAGHNTSLFVLGVMILWFGWYGFNPGSQLAIITTAGSSYSVANAVANAAVTTSLAPAAAGLTGLMMTAVLLKIKTGKHHWDIMAMGNSTLAGLVAITAGTSVVYPWAAIVIGIIAGIIYPLASRLMVLLKVSPSRLGCCAPTCMHSPGVTCLLLALLQCMMLAGLSMQGATPHFLPSAMCAWRATVLHAFHCTCELAWCWHLREKYAVALCTLIQMGYGSSVRTVWW